MKQHGGAKRNTVAALSPHSKTVQWMCTQIWGLYVWSLHFYAGVLWLLQFLLIDQRCV